MHMLVDLMIHNSWSDIDVKSLVKRKNYQKDTTMFWLKIKKNETPKNAASQLEKAIFNTKLSIRFGTNQPLAELVPNHAC